MNPNRVQRRRLTVSWMDEVAEDQLDQLQEENPRNFASCSTSSRPEKHKYSLRNLTPAKLQPELPPMPKLVKRRRQTFNGIERQTVRLLSIEPDVRTSPVPIQSGPKAVAEAKKLPKLKIALERLRMPTKRSALQVTPNAPEPGTSNNPESAAPEPGTSKNPEPAAPEFRCVRNLICGICNEDFFTQAGLALHLGLHSQNPGYIADLHRIANKFLLVRPN